MYYRLDCDVHTMSAYINPDGPPMRVPMLGQWAELPPDRLPVRYRYRDPTGAALFDLYTGKSLFSRRLVRALENAGVDNLQVFPTVLRNEADGSTREDYVMVNVLGLVSCADVDRSNTTALGAGFFFHRLVIDEARTHGLLMFRLAESLMDILIHGQVAEAIQAGEFRGIVLTPVQSNTSS